MFLLLGGREAWVCGRGCYNAWNDGEDVPVQEAETLMYHVGDVLSDGRQVLSVDGEGRITSLTLRGKQPEVQEAAVASKTTKSAPKRNRWSKDVVAKYREQINNGKATYGSIAQKLGLSYQTVWACISPKGSKAKHR